MAELILAIKATDGASSILQGLNTELATFTKTAGQKFTEVGQSMQKVGGAMSLAVTGPLAAIGMSMVSMASDMSETTSKIGVLFGESSASLITWAESAAQSLGMSKQQALDAASTFAVFGTAAGLTAEQMIPFTENATKLAADLASFYNTSPEQAINAIGAAMRGEFEPMRQYGVILDADKIAMEGVRLGLVDANGEFDKSKQAIAIQSLMLSETKVAADDYAETSGGLAGQQKMLTASIADMGTELGEQLLPIALEVVKVIKGLVDRFSNLSEGTQGWIVKGGLLLAAIGPILGVLGTLSTVIGGVISFMTAGGVAAGVLGTAFTVLTGPIGLIVAGVALLVTAWTRDWGGIQEKTYAVVGAVKDKLTEWGSTLGNWWRDNVSQLRADAEESGGWFNLWRDKATGAFETVKESVKGWGETFTGWLQIVWDKLKEVDWKTFGTDMIYGITQGIVLAPFTIGDALEAAAYEGLDRVKEMLGIHSPSKVAAEQIGVPFAEGIAMGIKTGMPAAMRSVTTNNYFSVELAGGGGTAGADVFNSVQMLSALYG